MYDISACYEAHSVAEAISLMKDHSSARIIAGGSDLLIQIRDGKLAGTELISIHDIEELKGVRCDECGVIHIGALTSFSHVSANAIIQEKIPVLSEALNQVEALRSAILVQSVEISATDHLLQIRRQLFLHLMRRLRLRGRRK